MTTPAKPEAARIKAAQLLLCMHDLSDYVRVLILHRIRNRDIQQQAHIYLLVS